MTKQINAKFTSRCAACGSSINPGDLISYDPAVKYSSRHVTCPATVVKSKVPLSSPGRGALQGRGRGDFFLGEKTEIVRCYAEDAKPSESDLGKTILATKGAEAGKHLTVVGVGAHWVSQNEADDFDMIGTDGSFSRHWSVTKYYRIATDEEAAPVIARAQEHNRKVAEAEALKAFERRVIEIGKDLEPAYSNRIDTPREGLTILRKWSTSNHPTYQSPYYRGVYAVQIADGRIGYRFTDSYYDWPQDYVVVVPEFFADEPPATEIC